MNIDDFRYMWRGKQVQNLTKHDEHLLSSINIRNHGNKHALLLLHGFSSSPAVYRELLPGLTTLYDAIVCPTLPGHGDSIAAFTAAKANDWLSTCEFACAELVNNYERVDVLGLSLGGLLACHLSERFRLHHLYLLAPALALTLNIPCALTLANVLRWMGFRTVRNRAGNIYIQQHAELAYRTVPINTVIEILTFINNYDYIAPTCPTDLFLGRYDKVVNTTEVEKNFVDLPNTTIHWLENSAHVLPLDGDLDKIVACIKGHLGTTSS